MRGGEHLAGVELVLADLEIVGRRPDDRRIRVPVVVLDLQLALHLGLDREDVLGMLLDRLGIVHRHLGLVADADAAHAERLAGHHRQQRRA